MQRKAPGRGIDRDPARWLPATRAGASCRSMDVDRDDTGSAW